MNKTKIIFIAGLVSLLTLISIKEAKAQQLHLGVSEGVYSNRQGFIDFDGLYSKTDIQVGINLDLNTNNFRTFGIYELQGNFKSNYKNSNGNSPEAFLFSSHLLGIGAENRFWKDKRVSLLIGFSALTEVASNFRNGYISDGIPIYPTYEVWPVLQYEQPIVQYQDFYHSTPFASSFYIGVDVKIIKGLHFNFSLESNIRIVKTREIVWDIANYENRLIEEIINEQQIETTLNDQLGVRFGLTYSLQPN